MRINPNISSDLLAALSNAQQQQNTALLQMASGRRVNKPSDDPTATAVLIQNQAESSQTDQYLRSVQSMQAQLQTTDSTLNSVVLALQRAISLGVQGRQHASESSRLADLLHSRQRRVSGDSHHDRSLADQYRNRYGRRRPAHGL